MKKHWLAALGLFAVTLAVYFPARGYSFVNYDDPDYVSANPRVQAGVTPEGIAWAFTSGDAANWFPVTRISHMLDCQLFGLNSGAHHMVNVVLHAAATVALFFFLEAATGAFWPSVFVAGVFALHPVHVESVAWISERKDVLCALFSFVALWAYVRNRRILLYAAFVLALMSKPMAVTLPFVMLLLDFWPLRRPFDVRSKVPLFSLSAASAIVTILVQKGSGAVESLTAFPFPVRAANALVSYLTYIEDAFWPSGLSVFYPLTLSVPGLRLAIAAVVLVAITGAAIVLRKSRPYLLFGWLWFLGTLVPVIGLVQVGTQAHADRYMYIPLTGLAIMLAFAAADLSPKWTIGGAVLLVACIPATFTQLSYWQNSGTLFEHSLAVTSNNAVAEHNLGSYLLDQPGRLTDSIFHLKAALHINPDSASIRSDLGSAYAKSGRIDEAMNEFQQALRINPNSEIVKANLASATQQATDSVYNSAIDLMNNGRFREAIPGLESVIRIKPEFSQAHNNLGVALSQIPGKGSEARAQFEMAVKLDPNNSGAHFNLGLALAQFPDRRADAIAELETADRLHPDPEVEQAIGKLKGH